MLVVYVGSVLSFVEEVVDGGVASLGEGVEVYN